MKNIIEKKDLAYWIIILVLVNIEILTMKMGDNSNIVNYVSFAGTITSIILAVVAIIYSFYQNNTYSNTTEKLIDSANVIEEVTKELKNVSNIENRISESVNSILFKQEHLCTKLEDTHGFFMRYMEGDKKHNNQVNENSKEYFKYNSEEFRLLLDKLPIRIIMSLYYLLKVSKNKERNQIIEYAKHYMERNRSETSFYCGEVVGDIFTTAKIFSALGALDFEYTSYPYLINVTNFNTTLEEELENTIKRTIEESENKVLSVFKQRADSYFETK